MSAGRLDLAVFLLSAAVLAFEVLLLRLFAIEHFHHFAYMAVGIAMLGFGASGTLLALARPRVEGREEALLRVLASGTVVAVLAAPAVAQSVAFEPTQILWDVREVAALGRLYATLAVPFLLGAGALAAGLMAAGDDRVGRVYGASLAGSGVGAGLVLVLLALLTVERALAATGVVAASAAAVALVPRRAAGGEGGPAARWRWGAAIVLALAATAAVVAPPWSLRVTPFKGLPQVEAFAGAERVGEASGPLGWVVAVAAPPFHHAPGLGLGFTGSLPSQVALFVDGSTVGAATPWPGAGEGDELEFLEWLPSYAPFRVRPEGRVLVLAAGGGTDVSAALRSGAVRVDAVELNPLLPRLQEGVLGRQRDPLHHVDVTLHSADARAFVARTRHRFDVVTLSPLGGFGAAAAGLHGAGEDYLSTVEAHRAYLRVLAPGGVLAVTRWLRNPPRDMVKAILTAAQSLRDLGVEEVGRSLVLVRSWSAATLLVKPDGFEAEELASLAAFAAERTFDVDWPPPAALPPGTAPGRTFHVLESPVYREAAEAAAAGAGPARAFAASYPFDVAPATDDRPYFGRFLRLGALPALLAEERGSWLPFAEWGSLAVLATLLQSAALALLLILAPGLWIGLRRRRGEGGVERPSVAPESLGAGTVYFAGIGLGYLLVEIAAIQKLVLVLGHPVYAASAVLGGFLVLSGVGSAASGRIAAAGAWRACLAAGAGAAALAVLLPLTGALAGLPAPLRAAGALLPLAPVAAVMGLPFPLGIRLLGGGRGLPWAWAVNGFASVVAVSLAAFVAMEAGSRAVLLLGAACYAVAGAAGLRGARERSISEPRPGDGCSGAGGG